MKMHKGHCTAILRRFVAKTNLERMEPMADIRLLERTLASNVAWNNARSTSRRSYRRLIQVKSVNLTEVASVFAGRAQPAAHYKRVQRFLRFFELSYASIAAFVLKLWTCLRRGC